MNLRVLLTILGIILLSQLSAVAQNPEDHLKQGLEYVNDGNFPKAMQCFTRSLELAEREGNRRMEAVAVGYIGNVYYNLFDYARCQQYYTRGYELAVRLGDRPLQTNFLTNVTAVCCKMGDVRQARTYFGKVLQLRADTTGSVNMDYYILYDSARLALAEGHPSRAIALHHEALRFAEANSMEPHYRLFQLCEIGQLHLAEQRPDSALAYAERCLKPAQRLGNRDFLTSVYQLLADGHAALGHKDEAERFRRLYFGLSDSLFNRKFVSAADRDLVSYEHRRTDSRISSLHHTILWQVVVIVIIVAVVIALTVLTRKLQRTNRRLLAAQRTVLDKNKELKRQEDKMLSPTSAALPVESSQPHTDDEQEGSHVAESVARELLPRIAHAMDDITLISNPDFSLQMLADSVGSNTRYVSAIINDRYGKNFKTLLNEHRIRIACTRLADREHYGQMTIQAIYEEVGYTNAVSFIRAFRKFNGMTPSEYQKIAAERNNAETN